MNTSINLFIFSSICVYIISSTLAQNTDNDGRATYIVHVQREASMGSFSSSEEREQWHKSFLPAVATASAGEPRLIYSYSNVFGGFAARLTNEELEAMKKKDGFIHATPDELLQLETTHSPSFLGLHTSSPGFWKSSNFGGGVIIGVLDTGVTPDHPSFRDEGMPSPPTKWKGVCEFSSSTCNNKLIGARTFLSGMDVAQGTPRAQEP
ncbi:putative cucumisin [Dioscorea sansibarensis]